MLHYFPTPKPDELLYSLIARFRWRANIPSSRDVNRIIFGDLSLNEAQVDFPRQLDMFQARVPSVHPLSQSNILEDHTLFPLYAPFISPVRADALAAYARGDYRRVGGRPLASVTQNTSPGGLRVCPRCMAEDWKQDGELYWRRLHRAPGVLVCPIHRVFLIPTGVGGPRASKRRSFLLPPESLCGAGQEIIQNDSQQNDLLLIAQHAQSVLAERGWRVEPGCWAKFYRSKLAELGYSAYNRERNPSTLIRNFDERFPGHFISRVREFRDIRLPTRAWLDAILSDERDMTQPPWRHFLFWIWLGLKPGQIRELLADASQSSNSPTWPKSPFKRPIDSPNWLARLESLWRDENVSIRAICDDLHTPRATVKRLAKTLNLPFPKPSKKGTKSSCPSPLQQERAKRLERRKAQWLVLRTKYPELHLKHLRKINNRLYQNLYYLDPLWLKQHLPDPIERLIYRVNWMERDKRLLEKLRVEYSKMIHRPGRPEKISVSTFARALGTEWLVYRRLKRMPESSRFLKEVRESPIQYAMRCIHYVAAQIQVEGKDLTPANLLQGAKVYSYVASQPQLRALIVQLCTPTPTQPSPA